MHQSMESYILRDWRIEDAPSIVKHADNRRIWLNLRDGFPSPYRIQDARAYIRNVNQDVPRTTFAIATASEAIGSIGLVLGKDVHRFTAELGYWLAEPFWGRGIMTRTVQYLTTWAFDTLKLHRIYAEPYSENSASRRVLEKSGFACEGILRSSAYKDGRRMDQAVYARLAGTMTGEQAAHSFQTKSTGGPT
jgi:ribosomal-protein-alanine N-acetyltransferase